MEASKRDEILAKEAEREEKMRRRMEREERRRERKKKKRGLNEDEDHLNPIFSLSVPDNTLDVPSTDKFFRHVQLLKQEFCLFMWPQFSRG